MAAEMGANEQKVRVLIVDDDPAQADMLREALGEEGFGVEAFHDARSALARFSAWRPEVVLSDLRMPELDGLQLFERCREASEDVIFFILTAFGTLETAVEAMRSGVDDFLTKPVDLDELLLRLEKALRFKGLVRENLELRRTVGELRDRVRLVGASEGIRAVIERMLQVAPSQATVLIHGESGTGKELVARGIHQHSPRAEAPFVSVNCAAVPDNLLEDELFGHTKGAFTGAVGDRKGKFEIAQGGTIFLDEIGDLPLHLQPKLLRALQEREIEPVGSNDPIHLDVRVVAATHRDLTAMVEEGEFREDLYYRLNVIPITIPPLRERREDVGALARHFLARFNAENGKALEGFSEAAVAKLEKWSWPGNVRELENCIERTVVLCRGDRIEAEDLHLGGVRRGGIQRAVLDALFETDLGLEDLERQIIVDALDRCDNNLSQAARVLGLTRRALQYRVEKIREAKDAEDG